MKKQSSFGKSTFAIIEANDKIEVHEYKRGQCRIERARISADQLANYEANGYVRGGPRSK